MEKTLRQKLGGSGSENKPDKEQSFWKEPVLWQGSGRNQLNGKCSERILIIGMVFIASSIVTKVLKWPSPLAMVLIKPTHQPWFL